MNRQISCEDWSHTFGEWEVMARNPLVSEQEQDEEGGPTQQKTY